MLVRKILLLFIFFSLAGALYAKGASEETETKTQNNEWILCITNFDASGIAEERRDFSGVITRRLVQKFNAISYRARVSGEYAYYEEAAWNKNRRETAKSLAAKQNERALLLYRGEPDWRYRASLANIDADIEKLRAQLEEIDKNAPLINNAPEFKLASGNLENHFPPAPDSGNEYRFCVTQKADAILSGSVSEYHGRYLLSLKLYALYTRSYVWEDAIVFSHGDIDIALEEITRRLLILLSGQSPARVAVTIEPEEALALINKSFAGRGETDVLELPPGTITVTASAPDYESMTFSADLASGEFSKITVILKPAEYGDLEILGSHNGLSGSVYYGAMYAGESPLTLRLPVNYMEYIEFETLNGEIGKIIYKTPDGDAFSESINIRAGKPPREGQADTARKMFYWSLGGTWLTGIASWLSSYSYSNMVYAYNAGGVHNPQLYNDAMQMYDIKTGTLIAASVFAVIDIILFARYLYLANKGSTEVKTGG